MAARIRKAVHTQTVADVIAGNCPTPQLGVEIGINRGRTTNHLLRSFAELTMLGVDSWRELPERSPLRAFWRREYGAEAPSHRNSKYAFYDQGTLDRMRDGVLDMAAAWEGRLVVLAMSSQEAARLLSDERFDFVFIDGDNRRCGEDIELWWPKVRPGGLLIGWGFGAFLSRHGVWDIDQAVDKFSHQASIRVESHRVWWTMKEKKHGSR